MLTNMLTMCAIPCKSQTRASDAGVHLQMQLHRRAAPPPLVPACQTEQPAEGLDGDGDMGSCQAAKKVQRWLVEEHHLLP